MNKVSDNSSSERTFRVFASLPKYPGLVSRRDIQKQLKADGFRHHARTVQRDLQAITAQPYIRIRRVVINRTPYYGLYS